MKNPRGRPKTDPLKRFWAQVKITDTCWLWTGPRRGGGSYGEFWLNGREMRAHRAAYLMFVGDIPRNLLVLHKCDNPPCVNPSHLFIGTQKENMADMVKKGRQLRGTQQAASKLTENDVRAIRSSNKTSRELAEEYGVSQQNIVRVKLFQVWKHVA